MEKLRPTSTIYTGTSAFVLTKAGLPSLLNTVQNLHLHSGYVICCNEITSLRSIVPLCVAYVRLGCIYYSKVAARIICMQATCMEQQQRLDWIQSELRKSEVVFVVVLVYDRVSSSSSNIKYGNQWGSMEKHIFFLLKIGFTLNVQSTSLRIPDTREIYSLEIFLDIQGNY